MSRSNISDRLIVGAASIAEALGLYKNDGSLDTRKVYYLAEKKDAPISRRNGLGLITDIIALERWLFDEDDSSRNIDMSRKDKFSRHETLDRSSLLLEMVDRWLLEKKDLRSDEKELAQAAHDSLFDLYQLVGSRNFEDQ